jgi:hypothetical protein
MDYTLEKIAKIERLDDFDDEYVYDIIMEDSKTPYFFANGILVHNSCYFKTHAENAEEAVAVADEVARLTNETFPGFMQRAFNCQPGFDILIKAGREVVARRGLFQAKKKYVLKVVDLEGSKVDKLKTQGSEIKKSDTPKVIQKFLKELMGHILSGANYSEVEKFVNDSRKTLIGKNADIFAMGIAKQVNDLDRFWQAWRQSGKKPSGKVPGWKQDESGRVNPVNIPGHVRAAFMYNELVQQHEEGAKLIKSGDKVRVFYLKPNALDLKSIALPAEMSQFPEWFADHFEIDRKLTEERMFDSKMESIFSAIRAGGSAEWEIPTPQNTLINKLLKF